jgi:predicted TPR repeat methyltransferase
MLADVITPPTEVPPTSQLMHKNAESVVLRMTCTTVFYEAAAAALDSEKVIWDFGCGKGLGTAVLRKEGRQVVGIDLDPPRVPEGAGDDVRFCSDLESAAELGSPDVVIIADVLGYLENPIATLLQIAQLSNPTTQLLIFEQRANVTQQLSLGKRRAYSAVELSEQATLGGWSNPAELDLSQTFVALSAIRTPAEVLDALTTGVALTLPDSPSLSAATHVAAATRATRAKNGEEATQLLIAALQTAPSNTHALCSLARMAQINGSSQEALHLLRQSLALDPTNLQAMQLWLELIAANSPQDLLATCQALANLSPRDPEVLTLLAQLHAESGSLELAIQDLELIRKQQPSPSLDLSITLAWLLHSAGRTADAQVEARLASVIAPESPDVAELLGALAA